MKSRLSRVDGVDSVHLNSLTGSLLIHFDPNTSTPETLMEVVLSSYNANPASENLSNVNPRPLRSSSIVRPLHSRAMRTVAKAACAYAGEMLAEQLVGALIAALL